MTFWTALYMVLFCVVSAENEHKAHLKDWQDLSETLNNINDTVNNLNLPTNKQNEVTK